MPYTSPYPQNLLEQLSRASSRNERISIIQRARQAAREQFPVKLAELERLLLQYTPYTTLATFAFIDLTYLPEVGRMNANVARVV